MFRSSKTLRAETRHADKAVRAPGNIEQRTSNFEHRMGKPSPVTTRASSLRPNSRSSGNAAGRWKAGNGRQHHPFKKEPVAEVFLQPAAPHAGKHHAQRHETGADGVVRGSMLPARDVNHVKHIGGEPESVAELLHRHTRANDPQTLRLGVGEINENRIRQMDRQQHRPEPALQAVPRNDQSAEQSAAQSSGRSAPTVP